MTPKIKNVIGIVGIAGLFSIAAVTAWALAPLFEQVPLDQETQCPKYKPLVSHTVVLVDETDPLSDMQARTLRLMLNGEANHLALYDQMTVLLLDPKQYEPQGIFSMCAPKNPRK